MARSFIVIDAAALNKKTALNLSLWSVSSKAPNQIFRNPARRV